MQTWEEHLAYIKGWIARQPNLPLDSTVSRARRGPLQTTKVFNIDWKDPDGFEYRLLRIAIGEAQEISILFDWRERVETIRNSHGRANEIRFRNILEARGPGTPKWFIGTQMVGVDLDLRGIDGYIDIKVDERHAVQVPYDIKSTKTNPHGKDDYFKKYPDRIGFFEVIILKRDDTDDIIRCRAFSQVGMIRSRLIKGLPHSVNGYRRHINECLK